jgi:hypothetical protein
MTSPKWFDPKISVGNLLALLAMVIALLGAWFTRGFEVDSLRADLLNKTTSLSEKISANSSGVQDLRATVNANERDRQSDRFNQVQVMTKLQADMAYIREAVDELRESQRRADGGSERAAGR